MKNENFILCKIFENNDEQKTQQVKIVFCSQDISISVFYDVTDEQGHKIPNRFPYKRVLISQCVEFDVTVDK